MRRANAGPVELLGELRALLREAEAWVRVEGGDAGDDAVARLREALARDMIGRDLTLGRRRRRPREARATSPVTGSRSPARTSEWVGVKRIRIDPGKWSTPLHLEGSEEEIFFVLDGLGRLRSGRRVERGGVRGRPRGLPRPSGARACAHAPGGARRARRPGVRRAPLRGEHARSRAPVCRGSARRGCSREAPDDHPWKREIAVGPPEVGELSERPAADRQRRRRRARVREGETVARAVRDLGRAAGSLKTGHAALRRAARQARSTRRTATAPRRRSSSSSTAREASSSGPHRRFGGEHETHPVRRGSVVARPAGTGRPHTFRAGDAGLAVLAYGTRDPRDVTFYPRSGKVNFRGCRADRSSGGARLLGRGGLRVA